MVVIIKMYLECTPCILFVGFVIHTQFVSLEYELGWVDRAETCAWNISE